MLRILKRFFDFCGAENKKKFYKALFLGVVFALLEAVKIPAILLLIDGAIKQNVTESLIVLCLGMLVASLAAASVVKYQITMLQCEAGYYTACGKRIEIAEHMRYLPMGYFNQNSLGQITNITTNTMEQLADVATRVVMMTTGGVLTSSVITVMMLIFDIRIGFIAMVGMVLFFTVNSFLQRKSKALAPVKAAADEFVVEKVLEYVQGISEVRSYNLTGCASKELNEAIDKNRDINTTMELKTVPWMQLQSIILKLSFVFQNVYLFEDTIANNIRFGQPEASMKLVMDAAKKACCHDFIMELPNGYDTVIGEGGTSLSGGEKQRISIARAIMKDAPVIILDEATANVDPENEKELMSAIEALTKEKTIIMIAHRLKTVEHADQILVLDKGQIVQQGRHSELLKQTGIYRKFILEREEAVGWKI